jgi:hypothetical protein
MTVASEVSDISYAGDGVTLAFAIPFNFLSNSDIQVSRRDSVGDTAVVSTGFTVTGAGTGSGTCTFTVAPTALEDIIIERAPEIIQPMDLTSNDRFPAETIETAHDRQAFISQYIHSMVRRSLRFPFGDASAGAVAILPAASSRLGKVLYFNATTGAPEMLDIADIDGIATTLSSTLIATTLDSLRRTASEISAGVTPTNYAYPEGHLKRYGATGDGSTDDTVAVHAAIAVAKGSKGAVIVPHGKFRVTSGYENSTAGGDVTFIGENPGYSSNTAGTAGGSCIILDNVSGSSYFYSQTAANHLTAENMQFACAQYALDREFFKASASSFKHTFDNVNFVAVEQPFVFNTGAYFQMNSYKNIRFTNSGSFHSKVSDLCGTLMVIDNCDVEGTMPELTAKVVCNLQGIRSIQARNLLIEPSIPSSGWIGLNFYETHDGEYVKQPLATLNGFYMECTGTALQYSVSISQGRVCFNDGYISSLTSSSPIRLENSGTVEFSGGSFAAAGEAIDTLFSLEDYACQVLLNNVTYHSPGSAITNPSFSFNNCQASPTGGVGTEAYRAASHDNALSQKIWGFDGGYPDPGKVTVTLSGGTTSTPTTNATYGRALQIIRSSGTIDVAFAALTKSDFPQGNQFFMVLRALAPTLTSATLSVDVMVAGSSIATAKTYTSGQEIRLIVPFATATNNPASVGVKLSTSTASGDLLIYQLEVWAGKSTPCATMPVYPLNIVTFNSAAPTAGTWVRGDIVWKTSPSSGASPGWVCTAAGTPGTWTAMANLA